MTSLPKWVDEVITTDVVVIGGGAAGLRVAHGLAPRRVDLLFGGSLGSAGSSPRAQGGIAAAVSAADSPARHSADTIDAGDGLNDEKAVTLLTGEARGEVERLSDLGMRFDRASSGALSLGREGAHSRDRILHADGDATGAELMRTLGLAVASSPHVRLMERTTALDLLCDEGRVVGVVAAGSGGRCSIYVSRAVVLATGGIGGLYLRTTNPGENRGSGLAMAARAGAELSDLEFVQFHPTALEVWADPAPLITEALRGAGATLVDGDGESFMATVDPRGDLAPRDIVAREVWSRTVAGGRVFLDARSAFDSLGADTFPTVRGLCSPFGIDPVQQPIPVSPAAHYTMGGVTTDVRGRTSLSGLWACGEVARSGAHGANRLASNSLLEALVFGGVAARDIDQAISTRTGVWNRLHHIDWGAHGVDRHPDDDRGLMTELRRRMWAGLGVLRDGRGLDSLLNWTAERMEEQHSSRELRSALTVALMAASAARSREESRGSHFRRDFPVPRPEWCTSQTVRLREAGAPVPEVDISTQVDEHSNTQTGEAHG